MIMKMDNDNDMIMMMMMMIMIIAKLHCTDINITFSLVHYNA